MINRERKRFRPRTWPEFCLLAQVLGVLAALRLLLPWVKLRAMVQWVEKNPATGSGDLPALRRAAQFTDALLRRMPFPLRGPCLPRALTLFYFARRSGLPAQLHCGVRRRGAQLEGHAWLTLNGRPLLERDDPQQSYAITFSSADPTRAQPAPHAPDGGAGRPDSEGALRCR